MSHVKNVIGESNHKQNTKKNQIPNGHGKATDAPRRGANPQNQNNNGKKQARLCPGRDIYERMNFLYQASMLMAETAPALSASYGKLMKSIGKKATQRIEPAIKRTLCIRCGLALIPGVTADYADFMKDSLSFVEVMCKKCNYSKRYCNRKGHKTHMDDPNFVVETINF